MSQEKLEEIYNLVEKGNLLNEDEMTKISDYILLIAQDYDNTIKQYGSMDKEQRRISAEKLKQEFKIMTMYSHKYAVSNYGIYGNIDCEFSDEKEHNSSSAFYNDIYRKAVYYYDKIPYNSSEVLATPLHEIRHAKQNQHINYNQSNIDFDPAFLLMAKEKIVRESKIVDYQQNHHNFIFENDANLYGKYHLQKLSSKYLNNFYNEQDLREAYATGGEEEQSNFAYIYDGNLLGLENDYEENKDTPIIIYLDKMVKQEIKNNPGLLYKHPILRHIYNDDGTPKSYEEIINNKNEMLTKSKQDSKLYSDVTTYTNYNLNESITTKTKIERFFDVIINSDSVLWFENCINNKSILIIRDNLEMQDKIISEYKSQFESILIKYSKIDGIDMQMLEKISNIIGSDCIKNIPKKDNNSNTVNLHTMSNDERVKYAKEQLSVLSVDDPMYRYYSDIIKNSTKTNQTTNVNNNQQQTPLQQSHGEKHEILPKEFHDAYNELFKEYYRRENGYEDMGVYEQEEFDEKLDALIDKINEGKDLNKDKDRIEMWNRVKKIKQKNPDVDLAALLIKLNLDEQEKIEKAENVEHNGRRMI